MRRHLLRGVLPSWAIIGRVQFTHPVLRAAHGVFTLIGQAVTLSTSTAGQALTGVFVLTGQAVKLEKATRMAAAAASFVLTGVAAGLFKHYPLIAGTGSFSLTGMAAGFVRSLRLVGSAGSFSLTGIAANLFKTIDFPVGVGSFTLTGIAAGLRHASRLAIGTGSFALTGQATRLLEGHRIAIGTGSFALTGIDATLTYTPLGGNDAFTVLLLHCDGTDASTTFTDSSASAHTITANGNAQVDTAQSVFGGASYLGDGSGDGLTAADSADWNFGSGNFALDARVRYASVSIGGLFGQWASSSNYWVVYRTGGAVLRLLAVSGGSTVIDCQWSWTPSANTWYHVAISRSGNSFRAFINGSQIGSTLTDTDAMPDIAGSLYIGNHPETASLNGWMDEVRISKGTDRGWTGTTITVPVVAYS